MTTAKQPLKKQIPEVPAAGDFTETEARLVGRMPDDAGNFPMNDMTDERNGPNECLEATEYKRAIPRVVAFRSNFDRRTQLSHFT